jgi:hypothetical protein
MAEIKTTRAASPPARRIHPTLLHWGQRASRAASVKPIPMAKDSSAPARARPAVPNKKRTLWCATDAASVRPIQAQDRFSGSSFTASFSRRPVCVRGRGGLARQFSGAGTIRCTGRSALEMSPNYPLPTGAARTLSRPARDARLRDGTSIRLVPRRARRESAARAAQPAPTRSRLAPVSSVRRSRRHSSLRNFRVEFPSSVCRSCHSRGGVVLIHRWWFRAPVSREKPKPEERGRTTNRDDSAPRDERPLFRGDEWPVTKLDVTGSHGHDQEQQHGRSGKATNPVPAPQLALKGVARDPLHAVILAAAVWPGGGVFVLRSRARSKRCLFRAGEPRDVKRGTHPVGKVIKAPLTAFPRSQAPAWDRTSPKLRFAASCPG